MDAVETTNAAIDWITIAGIMLLVIGFGMTIVEIFFPALGLFGITGVAAMIVGAVILHQHGGLEQVGIGWGVIAAVILTGIGLSIAGGWLTIKAMQQEVTTGPESLIGEPGIVIDWSGSEGKVHVQGEDWQAFAEDGEQLKPKDTVFVAKADGLKLKVRKQ